MSAADESSGLLLMSRRFVRFPPRWRNVLVPVGPRRATALGVTLYSASRPLPWLVQYVLWCGASLAGASMVPGDRETWIPTVTADSLAALVQQWSDAVGGRLDGIAVYERLQTARAGLTLLVCAGARSMLVRVRREDDELRLERTISGAARDHDLRTIRVPELIGSGEVDGWHWVGYEIMATRPHRPCYRLEQSGHAEVAALVESVVPRPEGTPSHWRGAHCDLTPWNLRRSRSTTWLIDWEDAQWAPPGTDALFLRATVAAMGRRDMAKLTIRPGEEEARAFCADLVRARPMSATEHHLRSRLLTALAAP